MNKTTGEIIKLDDKTQKIYEKLSKDSDGKSFLENFYPIKEGEATEKQMENKQVSKHDNRSKLGKKFTESRQVRRRKQRENVKAVTKRFNR